MVETSDKPNVEELYQVASNTSNLTVEADRRGSGDVLIAAGWSPSRVGMALLRLHSEFDAGTRSGGNPTETDFRLLMGRLKSLRAVREQVEIQAAWWQIDVAVALPVVFWWLDKTCRKCDGRKFERVKDTPALSTKRCEACYAEGRTPGEQALPHGEAGRRLANWMDACLEDGRGRLRANLSQTRRARGA